MSTTNPAKREVTEDANKPPQASVLDVIERITKVSSLALIPVVLAIGGWFIQQRLQDRTLSKDYVQLAVSILKEPEKAGDKKDMREWAVKLLNDNSPTKFSPQVTEQLKSGESVLPADFSLSSSAPAPTQVVGSSSGNPREEAANWEQKGFDLLVTRNAEAALLAFSNAASLWPSYHNVSEIKKLLEQDLLALKEGKEEAWASFYKTVLAKYSWGMPPEIKSKLSGT